MKKIINKTRWMRLVVILLVAVFALQPLGTALASEAASAGESAAVESAPGTDSESKPAPTESFEPGEAKSDDPATSDDETEPVDQQEQESKDEESAAPENDPEPLDIEMSQSTVKHKLPDADVVTGALTYQYSIQVPPGRNGLQPGLALTYNSQNTEEGSLVGYGWSLDIPVIERKNVNGLNKIYTSRDFTSTLDGDLKFLSGTTTEHYGAKIDNGAFNKYRLEDNTWTVRTKTGLTFTFGDESDSRISDPSDSSKVFRWHLTKIEDTNGNFVSYQYQKHDGLVYVNEIIYTSRGENLGAFKVVFNWQERPDQPSSAQYGYLLKTTKRLQNVETYLGEQLLGRTALEYENHSVNSRSLLREIEFTGFYGDQQSTASGPAKFAYQSIGATNLLTKITQNTGGVTTVNYKASPQFKDSEGNLQNPHLPFSVYVVDQLEYDDQNGVVWSNSFDYWGGWYYYNGPMDRRFVGFEKVVRTDAVGNTLTTFYHQGNGDEAGYGESDDDWAKAGKPYRSEARDEAGNLFAETINGWAFARLAGAGGSDERAHIKLSQSVRRSFDGNSSHKDSAASFSYDEFGNMLTHVDWGEVEADADGSFTDVGSDKVTTTYVYAEPTSSGSFLVGLPTSVTVINQATAKVSESRRYYDNLTLGEVVLGNSTKDEVWISGTMYAATTRTFSATGLVLTETDPRNNTTTYAYDEFELYPISATNALNQVTEYGYDYHYGQPTMMVDPNDNHVVTSLDGLGRAIKEELSDPTNSNSEVLFTKKTVAYNWVEDNEEVVGQQIIETHYLDEPDNSTPRTSKTITYTDGFERPVQVRSQVEPAPSSSNERYAVSDTIYNSLAQVAKTSLPYFSEHIERTAATTDNDLYAEMSYDALYRVVSVTNSVGSTTSVYDQWAILTTDAEGKQKRLFKDARGQLVQVDEYFEQDIFSTYYQYDAAGNLTKITDALDNIREFAYDGRGLRTMAEDLHNPSDSSYGIWTYSYDAAGNLIQRVDAKGQVVNFTYDALNRILQENYTGTNRVDLTHTYDNCPNGVGRLCKIVNFSVTIEYEYDILGQVRKETKQIVDSHEVEYAYDRQGSLLMVRNPDDSEFSYQLGLDGRVVVISTKEAGQSNVVVVSGIEYHPSGQVARFEYASGAITEYTYNAEELYRLQRKLSSVPDGSGSVVIQDLNYTYDNVGNILTMRDDSAVNQHESEFEYDDLHRLVNADITRGTSNYVQALEYDAIGNITYNSLLGHYYYEGSTENGNYANPHAVTKIVDGGNSETLLEYDANGNMSARGEFWEYEWDYNNRLRLARQMGIIQIEFEYGYDHTGSRVFSKLDKDPIEYVSSYFNIAVGSDITKHLLASEALVGTIKGSGATAEFVQIFTDHLGSVTVVAKPDGTVQEKIGYQPFGGLDYDVVQGSPTPPAEQRKYIGSEYDTDTQLLYLQARYYSGELGRFLGQDPAFWEIQEGIPDPQLMNSYSYARNNPLIYLDPNGEWPTLAQFSSFLNRAANFVNRLVDNGPAHGLGLYDIVNPATSFTKQVTTAINPNASKTDRVVSGVGVAAMVAPPTQKAGPILPTASKIEWGGVWTQGKLPNPIMNLGDHAERHSVLLGIDSISTYYKSAKSFVSEAIDNGYQATINTKGNIIRIWDKATQRFGSYDFTNGTLTPKTYFKSDLKNYWDTQQKTNPGQKEFDIKKLIQ